MLINIAGIDGCGKGTQLQNLADYLERRGRSVFLSKAYGPREKEMFSLFIERADGLSVMFLFQALHTEQRVRAEKALAEGAIVLADRWDESYLAYHSQNGVLANRPVLREELNQLAFGGRVPEITFLLRVPVDVAMERCRLRGADFFDRKDRAYHQTLSDQLDRLARQESWVVLDGNQPDRAIHEQIVAVVERLLK